MAIPAGLYMTLHDAAGATANGPTVDVGEYEQGSIQVTGTFVGQVQAEVSNDGTTWVALGSAISTPSLTAHSTINTRYYRARVSAWTSGAITVRVVFK